MYLIAFVISETVIGSHDNAVRCIEFCSELNLVISGGWDSVVKLWDPRSNTAVGSLAQPDRVCKHNGSKRDFCINKLNNVIKPIYI